MERSVSTALALQRAAAVACCALLFFAVAPLFSPPADSSNDFSTAGGRGAADVMSLLPPFMASVSNLTLSEHLKEITAEPHIAGTPANFKTAAFVKAQFESFGLKAHFADYPVLLSYPLRLSLSRSSPSRLPLALLEAAVPGDPYSASPAATPLFLGYSRSGRLRATPLVYANYGREEDFARLAAMGVDCKGAVALMRYGQIYRGNKVRNAAASGAVAAILFSDPADSAPLGTAPPSVYPSAPFLPPSGGQRGSLLAVDGDPQTPGWPSRDGGERLSAAATQALLPALPAVALSYGAAEHLLKEMGGRRAPRGWQGGLNLTYRVGPGPVTVDLEVQMNETVAPIRNVIAVLPGWEEPDKFVLLGNHRDAWVFGAADPNSGTACLLEVARCLSLLSSSHQWRPRRSIVFASWDAEEYGLTGSTEWCEDNEPLLSSRAVAYLNVDVAVCGAGFHAGATPQLDDLLRAVARQVPDPDSLLSPSPLSLLRAWANTFNASVPPVFRLGGGGSDFASFLQHAGIASADLGFGLGYPVYHSLYDNFHWMAAFGDPSFERHRAATRVWGSLALLLASLPVLPLNYSATAQTLQADVAALNGSLQRCLQRRQRQRRSEALSAAAAHSKSADPPSSPAPVSVAPLAAAVARLAAAAEEAQREALELASLPPSAATSARQLALNSRLQLAERGFTDPQGLNPTDVWYRHLVYGPSRADNYATLPFPAVADALAAAGCSRAAEPGAEPGAGSSAEWGARGSGRHGGGGAGLLGGTQERGGDAGAGALGGPGGGDGSLRRQAREGRGGGSAGAEAEGREGEWEAVMHEVHRVARAVDRAAVILRGELR